MIIDNIENMKLYKEIPDYVLNFVSALNSDTQNGKVNICSDCYANIEEYYTKPDTNGLFEAHRRYIDIQLLLKGQEKIYIKQNNNMQVKEPYNEAKDIEFFLNDITLHDYVTLDSTNFVMLFPHEAHAPQIAINNNAKSVKKVVIKLPV